MWPFSTSNKAVIEEKRGQRTAALTDVRDASEAQHAFLKATASEIVTRIGSGEWTASEVLEAYIARATFAHSKTNCLTEVMLEPARRRASELDREFAATKKLQGPLHGVPVSIKEQFDVIGYDTSLGFSQWAHKPATKNADIVDQLLKAGAIIYVKTNIPQTMFAFECSNPVWGRTTNPYNENYTCGGSSGGEAALLAMDGSAIGIGSDIGGSLRIPATYCGIYSLKPGGGRISYMGARDPDTGFDGIVTVAGPMGRSIKDLELVARVAFGTQSSNYSVAPIPFRDIQLPHKLRFGYYTSDKYIKASPSCQRAVLETVEALRKAGHECIEFEVPAAEVALNIFVGLTSADGYKTLLSHLGPDPKEKALFLATLGPAVPSILRVFAAWILETFWHDKLFADTVRVSKSTSVGNYWKMISEKVSYTQRFYETVLDKNEFDAIIAPVQALPQLPHGGCNNYSVLAVATILYNVLDMPTGCMPVTRVDPVKDMLTDDWITGPGHGSPVFEAGIYHGKNPLYNPEATKGMPINIQIVGRKWEDEKVLAIMNVVNEALGKDRGFGPGAWDAHMKNLKG